MNDELCGRVGEIAEESIDVLGIAAQPGTPIYLGQSNVEHMKKSHPNDFDTYGVYIRDILANPDYIGINTKDSSIEYVKRFSSDGNYVKVAVRASQGGTYYARSLYVLNPTRVRNFINDGALKPLTKVKV